MRHATLYRKWRPRAFSQIVGQEPVVRTLRRAIESDRVAHAYLFSGPRGTGKTSTAKVLAMGLNCAEGPTVEPDGTCENCRAVINNSSMDVLEMDAASNRGIDEIRDLRDRVNLAPAAGRMKVYIIDEVHMLTTEAFNALLKMLEEPPEHVIFVLATTEKHKVLPTIISRCQSFDFRRPSVVTLSERLAEIATAEGIEAEPGALTIIAREGKGSFRDAEGLLDQLSSFAEGPVTVEIVRELLGSVGSDVLIETSAALHERRAADALKIVDRLTSEGRDLGQFLSELLGHLRRVMLLPHAPDVALAEVGADDRPALEEQASLIPTAEVVRLVEALGDATGRMRRGGDTKLELELTFLKLARDYTEPSVDALLSRLEALESAAANGATVVRSAPAPVQLDDAGSTGVEPLEEPEEPEKIEEPDTTHLQESPQTESDTAVEPDSGLSVEALRARWPALIQDMKDRQQAPAAAVFEDASVEGFDDGNLEIVFPKELAIYVKLANESRHSVVLQEAVQRNFRVKPRLEIRVSEDDSGSTEEAPAQKDDALLREPEQDALSEDVKAPEDTNQPEPELEDSKPVEESTTETEIPDEDSVQSEAAEADDTIGSEQEAFALMREWFGSSKENGGS